MSWSVKIERKAQKALKKYRILLSLKSLEFLKSFPRMPGRQVVQN